eukprot:XP_025007073.1 nascent polypeptide-associated complex subunit alpha, muscle-specific form-like [Gallus gallus]
MVPLAGEPTPPLPESPRSSPPGTAAAARSRRCCPGGEGIGVCRCRGGLGGGRLLAASVSRRSLPLRRCSSSGRRRRCSEEDGGGGGSPSTRRGCPPSSRSVPYAPIRAEPIRSVPPTRGTRAERRDFPERRRSGSSVASGAACSSLTSSLLSRSPSALPRAAAVPARPLLRAAPRSPRAAPPPPRARLGSAWLSPARLGSARGGAGRRARAGPRVTTRLRAPLPRRLPPPAPRIHLLRVARMPGALPGRGVRRRVAPLPAAPRPRACAPLPGRAFSVHSRLPAVRPRAPGAVPEGSRVPRRRPVPDPAAAAGGPAVPCGAGRRARERRDPPALTRGGGGGSPRAVGTRGCFPVYPFNRLPMLA